ncbi:unnamed protein product [Cylicostephanus goldi]|uniref:Uncharacterized protein n=1 Tax=Cylicostephanus goldi TaxID=71465 RepID=A0A3P6UT70_CYLGO|nr:unnamed protein product [Cylicostephanus goldi]
MTMLPRRPLAALLLWSCLASATKVDDSVHYMITFERADNLEGSQLLEDNEKALKDENHMRISTQNNENYICKIPEARSEVSSIFVFA